MSDPLLIKRYASRRLYNTESSDYVTIEDVAKIIRTGREVKILDLKSGEDLTRQYLLQIITEHESRGENVLPLNVLTDLVRSYTDQAQSIVPDFLSQSFAALKDQQATMMENIKSAVPDPLSAFGGLDAWQKKQAEFMAGMMSGWGQDGGPTEGAPAPTPLDEETSELDEIKKQLAAMQEKLKSL
jgi:polyhydroxyalkanoate synthesis repressor PhaR